MSTRCQLIIQNIDSAEYKKATRTYYTEEEKNAVKEDINTRLVYHHYDGYLMGVGLELLNFVMNLSEHDAIYQASELDFLLNKQYESETIENKTFTNTDTDQEDDKPQQFNNLHGDIEYLYYIRLLDRNIVDLYFFKVNYNDKILKNEINSYMLDNKDLLEIFKTSDEPKNRIAHRNINDNHLTINFKGY